MQSSAPAPSDKAKGKRRALDPPDVHDDVHVFTTAKSLIIRFTDGDRDLTVHLDPAATTRDVKDMIRSARTHLSRRRLRLIHSGRLLSNNTHVVEWLDALNTRRHRRVSTAADGDEASVPTPGPAWLHCAVGPELEAGEEDEETVQQTQAVARGFDRLAAAGFSAEEIENLRDSFHARQNADVLSGALESEAANERALALEDQWMDNGGNTDVGDAESVVRASPIILGLMCGFFFPLLPLFFLKDSLPAYAWANGAPVEVVPTVIFSRRMQIGIILGLGTNVMFALWRYMIAVDDQHL